MNRKQRILAYVVTGLVAGLLVAGTVLFVMSRTEYGMGKVQTYALKWLTERVDGTVRIGSIGGRGLLSGMTLRDISIIDKLGRPFMRADSVILAYNWRTFVSGEVVIEEAQLFNPEIYFEQLPGDSIWNYQHVFPSRSKPGAPARKRLIMLNDTRIMNGMAVVRVPYERPADINLRDDLREVIDSVPGGFAKVLRFDSVFGHLSRFMWESPIEKGKLIDIRTMRGRGFVWREPMHLTDMRGTVTLQDTIVAFDVPDVRLRSSRASMVGRVIMEEGLNFFDVRVDSKSFTFRDMQWLYPRLPDNGGGSGVLRIQSQRPRGILWLATDTRIAAPGTRVAGSFGVVTGADSLYFTNVDLRASPLNLRLIEDILPNKLPVDGLLVGTVEVKGGLSALETRGDVQLSNASGQSGVKWRGTLDVKGGLGANNFRADLSRLDLALLTALRPELKLRGQVTGRVEASGNVDRSVKFAADIHHFLSGYTSSFDGTGTYTGGAAPGLDIELNAHPLSLQELASNYPALARLQGEARGPIRLFGALDKLTVTADLETLGGRALIDGQLERVGAVPRYSGEATLFTFRLDRIIDELPEASLDGKVAFDVTGTSIDDAAGTISARIASGRTRSVDFLDAHSALSLERGIARIDTFSVRTWLGELTAAGTLGLAQGRDGRLSFQLQTDSIAPLNGDPLAKTPVTARVRGQGTVTGSVHSFDLDANVEFTNVRTGSLVAEHLFASVNAAALGGADPRFTLREFRVGHRETPWQLVSPFGFTADQHGVRMDSLEVRRANAGRVRGGGRIAWHDDTHTPESGQTSDFRLDFEGVPFEELTLLAAGVENVKGTIGGNVRITGNAISPVLDGDATVTGFGIADATLDQVSGSFTYAGQRINARIEADRAGRRVFFADGIIPADLSFMPVAERKLAEPLRFTMRADSLPATFLTGLVGGFTDVRGRVDGIVVAGGTTANPDLSGSLTLKDGAAAWAVTGIRYRGVEATMRMVGDRIAGVEARLEANGGSANVKGSIDLRNASDPGFDLTLQAQNFSAAKRRDAEVTTSGNAHLGGRYRQPVVTGSIDVEHGALFLDELYRRYQIVELDNPLLYDVVDTSLVSLVTILPRSQNPFIKNLIVDDLRVRVGREAWLRSRDLNVEVSGELTIAFMLSDTILSGPRTAQDLILTGSLRAIRGTYQLYYPGIARQFSIREGTVEFPGTPGVDPNLGINAVYRARSARSEPIDIIAVVGGTMRSPRIRLTSDEEPPISESDLASYLFFGAPTYALSASQTAAVNQATIGLSSGNAVADIGVRALTSSGFGYLASGLQTFAQSYGLLDYVALTAAEPIGPGISTERGIASLLAGHRLELGRYVGKDAQIYIAYSQRLTPSGYRSPGVRVEWRVLPTLTGQFFVEDRFANTPDLGIQNTSSAKRVYGLFLFREWSY